MAEEQSCPNCGKPYQIGDEVCRHCGLVFPFSTIVIAPGRILQGRYEIQELIHTGGMGYIYSAQDKRLYDRPCIVKQVRESIKSESHQKKLEEEALSMTKLTNPNIAMIFDHFVEDGYYFLVVERISGKTLGEVLKERQGQFTEKEVLDWSITICDVVGYLHSKGVIHRDISPDNIMLTEDNTIKFIDFGTSHEFRYYGSGGTVGIGKYGYTPPEQWRGKPEQRSDIFALGATIYYLLTGFLPLSHAYSTGQAPQKEDFNPEFPPIRTKNPRISARLEAALQKALQLDIEKRYSSAAEFGQSLRSLEKGKKEKPAAPATLDKKIFRSRWLWAGIALSLISIGMLIVLAFGTIDKATPPERYEMYWALLIFCIPLIIGAFCLGRGLSRGRVAKRSWLWSGGACLLVEAVLLFFLAGNFVVLKGRTTDQEELFIFFTLLVAGAPFLVLSIYCFIKGLKLGPQPQPVAKKEKKPGVSDWIWIGTVTLTTGLGILIPFAYTITQQSTEAGRHGFIMVMLLFCVPVLFTGNCLLGMGLSRSRLTKRPWLGSGGGLLLAGVVLLIILLVNFNNVGATDQETAFLFLILFGACLSFVALSIFCFIRGQRQGVSPQAAPPARKRTISPWIITCASLVVAFLVISWITGAATYTPPPPDKTTTLISTTTTPPTTTSSQTSPLTPIEVFKSLQFESAEAVFDKNTVNGNEVFNVTITGKITCTINLKASISEILLVSEIIARKTTGGNEVTLNPDYTIKTPSSLKVANDAAPFTQKLQLQFPEQAEQGDYQIIMKNKELKVNADGWVDISAFLPKEQTLGTVTYSPSAAAASNYNYVEGYVYDTATSAPISGATVEIVNTIESHGNPSEEVVAKVQSNSSGYFKTQKFSNSGPLKVRASANGYETGWYDNTSDKAKAKEIYFKSGGETLNLKIFLQHQGSISGRVTADADGRGIANVNISVSDYDTNTGVSSAYTGSDGTYTVSSLPAGTYRVRAIPSNKQLPYADEWYNNTYDYNMAQSITITAGQNISGINFSLAASGSISGRVTADADGRGIPNLHVYVTDYSSGVWMAGANTNSDGVYTLSNLPPGAYRVCACPSNNKLPYANEYYDNTYDYSSAQSVSLPAGQNLSGIDFSLATGGSISGKITAEADGKGIANVNIDISDYTTNRGISRTNTNSDGSYTASSLPPGTYNVRASPSDSTQPYASKYYNNAYNWQEAQAVTVAAGQNVSGIDISLAPGGSISGTVRNADGSAPLANVCVECFRITDNQWEWLGSAGTDSQGRYTIFGVPYGRVSMRARGNMLDYVIEYYPEKARQSLAALLTVGEGVNPVNIDFTLDIGGSLSGKIISESTFEAIPGLHVDVWDYDTWEWLSCGDTGADGTFTVHGLPTGRCRVWTNTSLNNLPYIAEYYKDTTNPNAATAVTVTAGKDTSGINFALAPKSYSAASIQRAAGLSPPFLLSCYLKDVYYRRYTALHRY